MSKADLVNGIAAETGLTKADSTRFVEAFQSVVIKGLKKEGKVALTGFCTFTKKKKPSREARNPRTGEKVTIPARVDVSIKAGSKLKEALN